MANLREPLALDLFSDRWPVAAAQAVVCIIDPARLFLNEDQLYTLLGIRDEPGVPGQ